MAGLGKNGEIPCHHDCILDEELGLVCRICNVVCTEAKDIFPEMVGPIKAITTYFHYFHFGLVFYRMHHIFVPCRSMVMTITRRDLDAVSFTMMIMYLILLFLQSWDQSSQN
jgi:hypothetical protein